ncbi:MAG TPA: chromosome segregation protein SMC [Planctomycetota bacterium]|nr:chromosome segregation protein SMC [Planctomycetota bacterium]
MHLKRLEAFGFKSFADRLEFDFGRGVTGIVGPNGCGKSNVVDAVKWALGEQRPTSVRGTEMSDVLFAGASGRKPLGLAEVSLTFENLDRFLPIETDEVVLTRRLFRDGTSEYLLNREPSRLKDIRELFMDTGGGRGALAILEQGKIDAVLQENPVERRLVFEEAAGIARYRVRQRETLRRIEDLDENLVRLRDHLGMSEKQLRSMKSQAGRAERYRALEGELRSRRIELGLHRYARLLAEREEATARVRELADREVEAGTRLAGLAGDLRAREEQVEALRARAAALEAEAGKAEGAAEAAEERAAGAERLAGELEGRIAWYEGEIRSGAKRLEESGVEVRDALAAEAAAEAEAAVREADLSEAERAIAAAADAARDLAEEGRTHRARALELLDRRGRSANLRARLVAERDGLNSRAGRLARRRAEVEADEALRRGRADGAGLAADSAAEAAAAARAALESEDALLQGIETRASDLRDRLAALDRAVHAARSRLDVLTSLRDRHEGVGRGARRVLEEAAKSGGLPGVRGVLGELVEADAADAEAVELALGPFAEAIVVETFADAARAITLLKEEGIGRALFLPMDRVRAAALAPAPTGAPTREAAAVSRAPDDIRPILDAVLRGTLLAEDLESARAAAGDGTAGLRIVTGSGEVLGPEGGVTGGRGDGSGHGMVARNAEIRTLRTRLSQEEKRLSALQRDLRETEAGAEDARSRAADALRMLRGREESLAFARAAAEAARADLARVAEESALIRGEEAEVAVALARSGEELTLVAGDEAALSEAEAALEAAQAASHEAEAIAEDARRGAESRRAEARIEAARAAERRDAVTARRVAAERAVKDGERNLGLAQVELDNCRGRREESLRTASTARAEAEVARGRRSRAIHDLDRARESAREGVEALEEARRGLSAIDGEHRDYRNALEEFRLKESESRLRLEGLLDRWRDEVRVDLAMLHAERAVAAAPAAPEAAPAEPDLTVFDAPVAGEAPAAVPAPESAAPVSEDAAPPTAPFDPETAEREIEEIRLKMERMGAVNLEALDQLGEVERTTVEMRAQEQDLAKAREELLEAMRILNKQSRERFTQTFESIRGFFQQTFRSVFGGGRADVYLAEGEDVLEAGVEIVARPPGKEMRSISLLSGGERTMTAVALLFAVYQARPSPFCILDEVDAALDETNVGRFTSLVREALDKSQFIVITHNKRTMTMCDRLYGISMAEPGVSSRVLLEMKKLAAEDAAPAEVEAA